MIALPRSSYYYQARERVVALTDTELEELIGTTLARARTTDSKHDNPVFPNLYQNVIPAEPNRVWVGDFTYIRIAAGFCYLAATLRPGISSTLTADASLVSTGRRNASVT